MTRALFIIAILAVVAYAVFYRNLKAHVPPPTNIEQLRMRQAGYDTGNQDNQGQNNNGQGDSGSQGGN